MRIAVLFAIAALVCAGDANAQKFYKWKDADGVTHYTATPPPDGQQADNVAVDAAPAAPVDATGEPSASDAPAEGEGTPIAKQRAAACEIARNNLQILKTNPFVSMDKDGDGKSELLTAQEQSEQLERAEAGVLALCGRTPAGG